MARTHTSARGAARVIEPTNASGPYADVPFHFDRETHTYTLATGERRPHITGLLKQTGWTDDQWFTEESRQRGHEVHHWTAMFDLGAEDLDSIEQSAYRGYLLAYVEAMKILRPTVLEVEVPHMHPLHRYGGRPDRVWRLRGALWLPDIKTGDYEKGHPVQTALQAKLVEHPYKLPARMWKRGCLYLRANGRYKLEEHVNASKDFREAEKVIRECCR